MKNFISKYTSLLVAPLLLASAFQYASAQRVYDEFDAPTVVEGRLYIDYGKTPTTLSERFLSPYNVNLEYTENGAGAIALVPNDTKDGYVSLKLPFTIQYAGSTFPATTDISISVNGFVVFNSFPTSNGLDPMELFRGDSLTNVVAPYWGNHNYTDGTGGFLKSAITYQLTGVAPKRKLTIEWKNLNVNTKNGVGDPTSVANFQVSFYERDVPSTVGVNLAANNKAPDIEFAYGTFGGNGNISPTAMNGASVGINGASAKQFMNGLSYLNPATTTTSMNTTTFWPVSGTTSKTIRFETYQRSTPINPDDFFSRFSMGSDRDDGYFKVDLSRLNFDFTFAGLKQTNLWININGYSTFSDPEVFTHIVSADPNALYINSSSYPFNVVAPFWGDHIYRRGGEQAVPSSAGFYLGSEISYVVVGSYPSRRLILQWKNLNVNDKTLPNSVANFQAVFYEGVDEIYPSNYAGGIEFAYGDVGNNTLTTAKAINVKGSSVGLKGNLGGLLPPNADFINGLTYNNIRTAFTSKLLTDGWRPSGGASSSEGRRIFFRAIPRYYTAGWGDGDADLSQIRTRKHTGLQQNRFVTVNDARLIMRWLVNDSKLTNDFRVDSIQYGNSYHADVNHNGRFYYSTRTFDDQRDTLSWRRPIDRDTFGTRVRYDSVESLSGLPADIGPLRLIYFEATPLDAAYILHYNAGRIPSLPWIWDTIPSYGKSVTPVSNGISFGKPFVSADGNKVVPVYANAKTNNPFSFSVTLNAEVKSAETSNEESGNIITNDAKTVHFASSSITDITSPIAFITVNNESDLQATTKIVNDIVLGKEIIENNDLSSVMAAYPNPFENEIMVNVPAEFKGGVLTVSDVTGKVISTMNINQETMLVNTFAGYSAGVYTISMVNGSHATKYVVVKR